MEVAAQPFDDVRYRYAPLSQDPVPPDGRGWLILYCEGDVPRLPKRRGGCELSLFVKPSLEMLHELTGIEISQDDPQWRHNRDIATATYLAPLGEFRIMCTIAKTYRLAFRYNDTSMYWFGSWGPLDRLITRPPTKFAVRDASSDDGRIVRPDALLVMNQDGTPARLYLRGEPVSLCVFRRNPSGESHWSGERGDMIQPPAAEDPNLRVRVPQDFVFRATARVPSGSRRPRRS